MEATEPIDDQMEDGLGVQTGDIVEDVDEDLSKDSNDDINDDSNGGFNEESGEDEGYLMVDDSDSTSGSEEDEDYLVGDDSDSISGSDDEESNGLARLATPPGLDETLPMPAPPGRLDPNASRLETVRHKHDILNYDVTAKDRKIVTMSYHYNNSHNRLHILLKRLCQCLYCMALIDTVSKHMAQFRKYSRELSRERIELQKEEKSVWLELRKLEREDVATKKADAIKRRMATRKATMEKKTKKKEARKAAMLAGRMISKMRAAEGEGTEAADAAEKVVGEGGKEGKGKKGKKVGRSK